MNHTVLIDPKLYYFPSLTCLGQVEGEIECTNFSLGSLSMTVAFLLCDSTSSCSTMAACWPCSPLPITVVLPMKLRVSSSITVKSEQYDWTLVHSHLHSAREVNFMPHDTLPLFPRCTIHLHKPFLSISCVLFPALHPTNWSAIRLFFLFWDNIHWPLFATAELCIYMYK